MDMEVQKLEWRLQRVERELAELKEFLGIPPSRPWYEEIVGSFAGDPVFAEIIRLGKIERAKS